MYISCISCQKSKKMRVIVSVCSYSTREQRMCAWQKQDFAQESIFIFVSQLLDLSFQIDIKAFLFNFCMAKTKNQLLFVIVCDILLPTG